MPSTNANGHGEDAVAGDLWKHVGGKDNPPTYTEIGNWTVDQPHPRDGVAETTKRINALLHGAVPDAQWQLEIAHESDRGEDGKIIPRPHLTIRGVCQIEVPIAEIAEDPPPHIKDAIENVERIGGEVKLLGPALLGPELDTHRAHRYKFMVSRQAMLAHRTAQNEGREATDKLKHPFTPLVRAYCKRPTEVRPDLRRDKAIVPKIPVSESPERQMGRKIGGLTDYGETALPALFPDPSTARLRVPLLEIADTAGVPIMAGGRGAPLAARMFVRLLISIPQGARDRKRAVMVISIRELANLAGYGKRYNKYDHLPKMWAVLENLHRYTVPSVVEGSPGRWSPLFVRHLPINSAPDELAVIDVAYPPNADTGPMVRLPDIDRLAMESAPRWRAYIAAHTLAFEPGKTQIPIKRGEWVGALDKEKYPVLDRDSRRQLAFGTNDTKHRSKKEQDAPWQDLPGLVLVRKDAMDLRDGVQGYRYVPTAVAERWEEESRKPAQKRRG